MFQIYKKDNKHAIIAISVAQHCVEQVACYGTACIPVNLLHCRDPKQMARLTHTHCLSLCLCTRHSCTTSAPTTVIKTTVFFFFHSHFKKISETHRNKCHICTWEFKMWRELKNRLFTKNNIKVKRFLFNSKSNYSITAPQNFASNRKKCIHEHYS